MRSPVDVGPVAGEAVVDHDPVAADGLELGVQARDLGVPRERDVALGAPADRRRAGEEEDDLRSPTVAVQEERSAAALGVETGLDLSGRRHRQRRYVGLVVAPMFPQPAPWHLRLDEGRTHRGRAVGDARRRARRRTSRGSMYARRSAAGSSDTSIGGGKSTASWFRAGNGKTRAGGDRRRLGTDDRSAIWHQGDELESSAAEGRRRAQRRGLPEPLVRVDAGRATSRPRGWASAVDASGGDNYGSSAACRPATTRTAQPPDLQRGLGLTADSVGGRPAPVPTRPEDAGGRRRPGQRPRAARTATTSTTRSTRVRPRSSVTAATRTAAAPTPRAASARSSRSATTATEATKFKRLKRDRGARGREVHVWCTGKRKGCPKSREFTTSSKGSVSLRRCSASACGSAPSIDVAVSDPNASVRSAG